MTTIRQHIRNAFFCENSVTIYAEIEKRKASEKACEAPAIKALEELLEEVLQEEAISTTLK